MSSPRGEPVGAVFGFARDLFFLIEEKKPDYLFCAFDMPGKTFRHEMYDQYKIQRPEMDADLVPQIASIRRVLEVLGIPALGVEGFEADDILATVARLTDELGGQCILVTNDKDCRQLITDRVKVFNIRKNTFIDRDALKEDWGITPEQVVDYQALVGDAVDNVPGVPLIGPKFARQLLEQYGTLESVLDHAADVAGAKRKENLVKFRDQALLEPRFGPTGHARAGGDSVGHASRADRSHGGTGLVSRVRFPQPGYENRCADANRLPWEGCFKTEISTPQSHPEPSENSTLQSHPERSEGSFPVDERTVETGPHPSPLPRGEGTLAAQPTYHLVDTPEAFETFLNQLNKQKSFSLDTETTNIMPRWAELVGLSFSWDENEAWYLPVRSPPERAASGFAGHAQRPSAGAGRPNHRENRAESEVRYYRPARGGRKSCRHGLRHNGGKLSARRRAAKPQPRRSGPGLSRAHDHQDQPVDRFGQESKTDGRGSHPAGGRLRRRRRSAARPFEADLI